MAGQVLGTPYYMSPEQWGEISRDGNSKLTAVLTFTAWG